MMFLTHEELIELTGRRRRDAQIKALRFMGIEHRVRPNGSVAVLKMHVEQQLGANEASRHVPDVEPNWAAI